MLLSSPEHYCLHPLHTIYQVASKNERNYGAHKRHTPFERCTHQSNIVQFPAISSLSNAVAVKFKHSCLRQLAGPNLDEEKSVAKNAAN